LLNQTKKKLKEDYKDLKVLGESDEFDRAELLSDPGKAFDKLIKRVTALFTGEGAVDSKEVMKNFYPNLTNFFATTNKYGPKETVQNLLMKMGINKRSDFSETIKKAHSESDKLAAIKTTTGLDLPVKEDKKTALKLIDFFNLNSDNLVSLGVKTSNESTVQDILTQLFKYQTAGNALPIKGVKYRDYE